MSNLKKLLINNGLVCNTIFGKMDCKSPAIKRQKLTMTFSEVREDLNLLNRLRNNAGTIINDLYDEEKIELLSWLTSTEVELRENQTQSVPHVDKLKQNYKQLSKQHNQTINIIKKSIFLLKLLEQKRNCSIAKIVDDV